jgi:hypothetical protein
MRGRHFRSGDLASWQLYCRVACLLMRVARRHDAVLPTFRMRIVFDLAWQIPKSRELIIGILPWLII